MSTTDSGSTPKDMSGILVPMSIMIGLEVIRTFIVFCSDGKIGFWWKVPTESLSLVLLIWLFTEILQHKNWACLGFIVYVFVQFLFLISAILVFGADRVVSGVDTMIHLFIVYGVGLHCAFSLMDSARRRDFISSQGEENKIILFSLLYLVHCIASICLMIHVYYLILRSSWIDGIISILGGFVMGILPFLL